MKVKITLPEYRKCLKFCELRTKDAGFYKKRGGFKAEDIISGAMAELAVYHILSSFGFSIDKPDFTEHKRKSFSADLTDGQHYFHIKSQTTASADRYGTSWILQREDKLISSPKRGHYLIPCKIDMVNLEVELLGCVPMTTIVEQNLVGECKLEWFRRTKVAIYWGDIEKALKINQKWSILYKKG